MSTTNADYASLDDWQELVTNDGYWIVGSQHSAWFVQEPRLHRVAARPPAHLTIVEALIWFRQRQLEERTKETT